LQKEIEESIIRNEGTQKRIKIIIEEFIKNAMEQSNSKILYINNRINQIEEKLDSLHN
jgi:hypothetical protein